MSMSVHSRAISFGSKELLTFLFTFFCGVTLSSVPAHARARCLLMGSGLCQASCSGDTTAITKELVAQASADEQVCALGFAQNGAMVHLLARMGVNVNTQKMQWNKNSPAGRNALFRAIFGGYDEVFDALLENQIDVNAADRTGETPLMMASGVGQVSMVTKLLSVGASVNAVDRRNRSALCYARMYPLAPHRDEIVQVLASRGARCESP